ncbi:hypothetical protein APS56_12505 [Pseudalgibacter alginicilyticus]|uniref:DUF1853 domain-containing protein n=1 Tax=Pseudalgibacter alginicilyticus TaxID=1736674 RepID=A0A0P0DCN5_9FLAO|nr:DUF1853 family protein [Pseudalgibacter alginicilyticus]ALJ05900.1 hypothetical protein APS56_12505 [Pseudalgibacter alginicilyticus]
MLQKRYEGFLKTPYLWKHNAIFGLQQFEINSKFNRINREIDEKLRLGKYVERLVTFELGQHHNVSIIAENIQIQNNKTTLGELDCLLFKDGKPIHLEIVYKFYLYDNTCGFFELEHFIGPNRKDSLIEKLGKLKEKQLPLLYNPFTENYLTQLKLTPKDIKQEVYFKAQLFIPYTLKNLKLKMLNSKCIMGFYINPNELNEFKNCTFYIPDKKDWLTLPHLLVNWLDFETFKNNANNYLERNFSPLFWVKYKNNTLTKMFLVWW